MKIDTYTTPYRPLEKGAAVWVSLKQGFSDQYAYYPGKMAQDYNNANPKVLVLTFNPGTSKVETLRVPRSAVCKNEPLARSWLR